MCPVARSIVCLGEACVSIPREVDLSRPSTGCVGPRQGKSLGGTLGSCFGCFPGSHVHPARWGVRVLRAPSDLASVFGMAGTEGDRVRPSSTCYAWDHCVEALKFPQDARLPEASFLCAPTLPHSSFPTALHTLLHVCLSVEVVGPGLWFGSS